MALLIEGFAAYGASVHPGISASIGGFRAHPLQRVKFSGQTDDGARSGGSEHTQSAAV